MITDHGKSFRPEDVVEPNVQAPLSYRKASGLGLYMMKKCMDDVTFDFQEGCNTLTMVKFKNTGC